MKNSSILLGVLVAVSPVWAAPASFFDSFEYAEGVDDPAYAAHWSVGGGANRYPIVTRIYEVDVTDPGALDGTKVALSATPAPSGGYGITHGLGAPVEATNASPLVVKADFHSMATSANRALVSFCLELSQGDAHVPALGTAPLSNPIPAVALAVGMGAGDNYYKFFNGTKWNATNLILWAGYRQWNWQHLTLTFTDLGDPETQTGKRVAMHLINNDGSVERNSTLDLAMPASAWLAGETFDSLSLRAFDGVSFNSIIDSVSVTGGEVIPEPAALALLGLGLPWIWRRRKA